MGGLLGGAKGYVGPPLKLLGGPGKFALYLRQYQKEGIILCTLVQSDTVNDLILFVGHSDLYFMVQ